jgi:hypothetical protein
MNCPTCGNPLEGQPQFCPKCFAPIEAPNLWRKLLSLFQPKPGSHRPLVEIKRTITVNVTEKDGPRHEYHSADELPADLAAEVKKLESKALSGASCSSFSDALSTSTSRSKSATVYKMKDSSGMEHVYHSLEEMPPQIRAAFEKALSKRK